jgi:hypothetical protein
VVQSFAIEMGESQLIIAQDGQYVHATVNKAGKIVREGSSVIRPADLVPLGLQDRLSAVVIARESATADLVFAAGSRANEFGADYFLLGRERRETLLGRDGFEVVFAETQAYVRNPAQR